MNRTLVLLTSLLTTNVFAAESQSRFIEEIIVTGDKIEKSAQDTPIAISAFDDDAIEDFSIDDAEDLAIFVPSFSRTEFDFTIRGIGRHYRSQGGSPGVSLYQNGIYIEDAFLVGIKGNQYDVEQIEVLRGPQGTLFGQHAIAGAVSYINKKPTSELSGELETVFGDHNTEELYGFVSGPIISNKLNARLTANKIRQSGDRSSKAVPGQRAVSDTGALSEEAVALTLDFFPTDTIELTLRGSHREFDNIPRAQVHIGEGDRGQRFRYSDVCYPQGSQCFSEPVQLLYNFPAQNSAANQRIPISGNGFGDDLDNEAWLDYKPIEQGRMSLYSIDAKWHFNYDQLTLRYLGGSGGYEYLLDRPWSAPGGRNHCLPPRCEIGVGGEQYREDHFVVDIGFDHQSHELQFISNFDGSVNFVAGLYYYKSDQSMELDWFDRALFGSYTDEPQNSEIERFFGTPTFPGWHNNGVGSVETSGFVGSYAGAPNGTYLWQKGYLETTSVSTYGRLGIALSDKLRLTLGGRWSKDRRENEMRLWSVFEFEAFPLELFNALLTTDPVTNEYNGDAFRVLGARGTYQGGAADSHSWVESTWRVNLDWQPQDEVLYYVTLSTGYRPGGFVLGPSYQTPFAEEKLEAFEVGAKLDLWGQRLRLNLAAYIYNYENQQISAVQPVSCSLVSSFVFDSCEGSVNLETTLNVPESRIAGFEIETIFSLTPVLNIGGTISYMDTEVRDDWIISTENNDLADTFEARDINLKGQELVRAPEKKATLWANYNVPLGNRGKIDFMTIYGYTGVQHQEILNLPINKAPSFDRWDFRATWTSVDRRYRVSAFVNNVEDELGIISIETLQNTGRRATTTSPRTWGIQFKARFGAWE